MLTRGIKRGRGTAASSIRPAETDIDYRALSEFRHQIRKFLTFSETEARHAGVEPQQHQVLLAVKGLPEGLRPTIRVIADRLQLRHHTIVGLVDRLVAAKLVSRKPSDTDGREIIVSVTANGERILRSLSLAHKAELETRGPALAAALDSVTRSIEKADTAANRSPT
jgi:DNA-binding MarR family transcriptional regulator